MINLNFFYAALSQVIANKSFEWASNTITVFYLNQLPYSLFDDWPLSYSLQNHIPNAAAYPNRKLRFYEISRNSIHMPPPNTIYNYF